VLNVILLDQPPSDNAEKPPVSAFRKGKTQTEAPPPPCAKLTSIATHEWDTRLNTPRQGYWEVLHARYTKRKSRVDDDLWFERQCRWCLARWLLSSGADNASPALRESAGDARILLTASTCPACRLPEFCSRGSIAGFPRVHKIAMSGAFFGQRKCRPELPPTPSIKRARA